MDQEQPNNTKTISALIVILLVFGIGYILFTKFNVPKEEEIQQIPTNVVEEEKPMVVVENTPMVNGAMSVPNGFPQDIPLEKTTIIESATTKYPDKDVQQLSVSYHSANTITQKYTEYKNYMSNAGYSLTEGSASAPVRAIFGTKASANLSVAISSSQGKTLVQLSYLLK